MVRSAVCSVKPAVDARSWPVGKNAVDLVNGRSTKTGGGGSTKSRPAGGGGGEGRDFAVPAAHAGVKNPRLVLCGRQWPRRHLPPPRPGSASRRESGRRRAARA